MNIQYYVNDSYPLSSLDVKKLVQEATTLFTAAVKGDVDNYFKYNDDVRAILDKLRLWEEKNK